MGKSKHRKKKRVEEQGQDSSSSSKGSNSDSDTSEELTSSNRKRKATKRSSISIIFNDASPEMGNDDLYPARETRLKEEESGGGGDGLIQTRVEVNEDDPNCSGLDDEINYWNVATAFCLALLLLHGAQWHIPTYCPCCHEESQPSTDSVSEEVDSSSSLAPFRKSDESSSNAKEKGHTKSTMPAVKSRCSTSEKDSTMEEPNPNHLNGDHETPSTSSLPGNSEDSSGKFGSDGGHMLPSLPTCYRNRRVRIWKGRTYLSEEAFFNTAVKDSTIKAIAICGSTGMGKTTLLAQMGRKIISAFPGRKLFYLEMKNVVGAVKKELEMKGWLPTELIWKALRRLTEVKELGSLTPKETRTELFLDGFDDVSKTDEKLVCNILKCISDSFNSTGVRMLIATDPISFKKLGNALQNVKGYSIEPLDYSSQVELIASYLEMHTSEDKPKLLKFVEKCIKDLAADDLCDFELGNPLQCLLVGAACLNENDSGSEIFLLSKPKNILCINDVHQNLLLDAAWTRSFHTLKLILDLNKFDINCSDIKGDRPLFLSVYAKGNVDCLPKLKLFVEKGANLDCLNKYYENLLLYAAKYASVECLNYILNLNKFDLNCVDKLGNTPLFLSADGVDGENIDCLSKVKLLIRQKANVNHLKDGKYNLLLNSAQFASAEVFEYILGMGNFDINSEDDDGDTPLLLSVVQYKGIDCLKKLKMVIGHGGNLNHLNKNGASVLHYAARHGSLDVLRYVINLDKFDINSRDKLGKTAVDYAKSARGNWVKAKVQLLLEKGCVPGHRYNPK